MLRKKYTEKGQSVYDIANDISCSKSTIVNRLHQYGIEIKPKKGTPHKRPPRYGEKFVKGNTIDHLAELRVIKSILKMRETGLSLRQIAKVLDELKVPTKNKGRGWHPEMISRILKHNKERKK